MDFIPLVFEMYGRWGGGTMAFYKDLIKFGADNRQITWTALDKYWKRRVSLTMKKTIARVVLSSLTRFRHARFRE